MKRNFRLYFRDENHRQIFLGPSNGTIYVAYSRWKIPSFYYFQSHNQRDYCRMFLGPVEHRL